MSTLSHSICLQPLRLLETDGGNGPLYSSVHGCLPNSPAVMIRHLLTFLAYSCPRPLCFLHLKTNLLVFVFAYVGCLLPFLALPPVIALSFFQGVPSCHLSPRLSIVFPVWWPTAFFCPHMHKSGISHAMPSCPKTLYILSDLPVMKRFSFSSHFQSRRHSFSGAKLTQAGNGKGTAAALTRILFQVFGVRLLLIQKLYACGEKQYGHPLP